MEITSRRVPQSQLMAPPLWSKQQDLTTEASLYPTSGYHVHSSIGGPGRREVCQLQVAIPDLVVVPQMVMPTLALFGEKEGGTWGAFLWEGWWLVGCARHWVEEAWQLRVFHVARDWHTLHTYEDPWGTGRGCELPGLQLDAKAPESPVTLLARCCLAATGLRLWVQSRASSSKVSGIPSPASCGTLKMKKTPNTSPAAPERPPHRARHISGSQAEPPS